tara:strand:- start:1888 stop:2442 length:555 start_codon:yes stop_codon:yes gene_type:complete
MNSFAERSAPSAIQDKDMLELQRSQLKHDQLFHPDILALRVHERTVHYVLHFAKYSGRLIEAELSRDFDTARLVTVDAIIISLAFCNMFNIKAYMPAKAGSTRQDFGTLIKQFAICSGRMAKTAESIDHLEALNFRVDLEGQIGDMLKVIGQISSALSLDVSSAVIARLDEVEKKSIFYPINSR